MPTGRFAAHPDLLVRFFSLVSLPEERDEEDGACWLWVGATQSKGYGHFWCEGKMVLAHRFSYKTFVGELKPWLSIDHEECRVQLCVNPEHLKQVPGLINRWRQAYYAGLTDARRA